MPEEKITSLALPRLATGVGGLDWADVKPLIEQYLGGLGIPVVVDATYRKGVAADEGLQSLRPGPCEVSAWVPFCRIVRLSP